MLTTVGEDEREVEAVCEQTGEDVTVGGNFGEMLRNFVCRSTFLGTLPTAFLTSTFLLSCCWSCAVFEEQLSNGWPGVCSIPTHMNTQICN